MQCPAREFLFKTKPLTFNEGLLSFVSLLAPITWSSAVAEHSNFKSNIRLIMLVLVKSWGRMNTYGMSSWACSYEDEKSVGVMPKLLAAFI